MMHDATIYARKWDGTTLEIKTIGRFARGEKITFDYKGKMYTRVVKQRKDGPLYVMFKNWRLKLWVDMEKR